jgi:hypothetical protein
MKIFFRKLHRWLGLLMAVQIIAWMASGLYFSIFPIDEIRGAHLTRAPEPLDASKLTGMGSPSQVMKLLNRQFPGDWSLSSLKLIMVAGQAFWRVEARSEGQKVTRLIEADGQSIVPRLDADQAEKRARGWLLDAGQVSSVELITEIAAGAEYRGSVLPVWKVSFDQAEAVNLYIDPWTGELLARRTKRWRIFDFLWMLHIMDFDTRDDFNHPLLQISSMLGLIIALSGVIFWAMTTRLFRRRRPS